MNDTWSAPRPARSARAAQSDGDEGGARLPVRLLTEPADFVALAVEWNRLHEGAAAASVFTSWLWQYQWWEVYGRGQPLRLLVATQGGQTVGILPLYVQTVRVAGMPVRLLRLVGSGGDTHPDDLGPILAAGYEKEAGQALADAALRLASVDVLQIADLDPRSGFAALLEATARREGLASERGCSQRISYIQLPATWQAYLASLDGKQRRRMRLLRKKLAEGKPSRFFLWEDPAEVDYAVDRLARLHRKRWSAAGGGSGSFATQEYIGFHRAIIKACLLRGQLRLYCLEIDGEIAAIQYAYRFRNGIYLMQTGFDPEHLKWTPGFVLLGYAIEHAIGEGNVVFDFLRGTYRYKDEVCNGERETEFTLVYRPTLSARAFRLRRMFWPKWKRKLKGFLRDASRRLRRVPAPP